MSKQVELAPVESTGLGLHTQQDNLFMWTCCAHESAARFCTKAYAIWRSDTKQTFSYVRHVCRVRPDVGPVCIRQRGAQARATLARHVCMGCESEDEALATAGGRGAQAKKV
eukprot:403471-Prymnesium_polylepis.1